MEFNDFSMTFKGPVMEGIMLAKMIKQNKTQIYPASLGLCHIFLSWPIMNKIHVESIQNIC